MANGKWHVVNGASHIVEVVDGFQELVNEMKEQVMNGTTSCHGGTGDSSPVLLATPMSSRHAFPARQIGRLAGHLLTS